MKIKLIPKQHEEKCEFAERIKEKCCYFYPLNPIIIPQPNDLDKRYD